MPHVGGDSAAEGTSQLEEEPEVSGSEGFKRRNGDAAFLGEGGLEFGKGALKGGSDLGGLGDVPGSGQGFGGEGGAGGVPQGGIRGLEGVETLARRALRR